MENCVLGHAQTLASFGDGTSFRGGSATCDHSVASGSASAGLAWECGLT